VGGVSSIISKKLTQERDRNIAIQGKGTKLEVQESFRIPISILDFCFEAIQIVSSAQSLDRQPKNPK
jgi:hypothetical protein